MPEITNRYIKKSDLENMKVLKIDKVTKKPKIWLDSNGIVYKKEDSEIVPRRKDYFEYFSELDELKDCIFPREILYTDSKLFGYTDHYINEYRCMNKRIEKYNITLEEKKLIINKLINLIKCLHKNEIAHNDLHSGNLLTNKKEIKLIDFARIKIKEIDGETIFNKKLKLEMYYLNLLILSILFDKSISNISKEEYKILINELPITNEYKEYLLKTIKFDNSIIGIYPENYIKNIGKKTINKSKELIINLKL